MSSILRQRKQESVEDVQVLSKRGLAAFQNYNLRENSGFSTAKKSQELFEFMADNQAMTRFNRTDYFLCEDFDKIPRTSQTVRENMQGNRGITFMKVSIGGKVIDVVHKLATNFFHSVGDDYKYSSAKREIEFLSKLRELPGIPHLLGSCIKEDNIRYFVERIKGHTLCHDNGTTPKCAKGVHLLQYIRESPDPQFSALKIAYTTVRLFKLLEERHLFLEDISGINLMLSYDFEVFLVDADSLVFYNKNRLFSRLSCKDDTECVGPHGNLWQYNSLNLKIYKNCVDLKGMCRDKKCRGFDTSLHACGMAEWYLCRLVDFFQDIPNLHKIFESVCLCLRHPHPDDRCTFAHATIKMEELMNSYIKMKQT